ncbi:glycosyltransferase [Paenibacillus sp. SYP-B3998]|uniref:Glycosyltransferase n=1 Tax=Paenibacillus sp. SYP-B3998 TaxID=2678564 RepID=A0A6G3ZUG7_9BACL|nr:glycosyltransferase [Paenibacillus sp. SYP-B3998]NEW05853.1 glycosyltransferase [Paenibacillus sp. SYP-B3998]
MKILMVVSRLNIGGTEKYILSISRYLISKGVQVGIATMGGPLAKSSKKRVAVHLLPMRSQNRISSLSSIISKNKYNLIHVHDSMSFHVAASLHRQHRIPLIATVHGTYHNRKSLSGMSKVAKTIISVSPQLSKWMIEHKIPAKKIKMIPNGIDTLEFSPISNKTKWRRVLNLPQTAQILVHAGRFSFDKYPIARKVIMAAEIIAKNNPNFVAVLFGPGDYRSKLIQHAAKVNRGLGRQAILIRSPLSKIQYAYYAADVVIGTGRVALEAMACGRPVVAAGVKGYCGIVGPENINKIIQHHFGDHGTITPITVEKLSRDIKSILNNSNRARMLSRFGAETVKNKFSIKRVGSQLLAVYKKY